MQEVPADLGNALYSWKLHLPIVLFIDIDICCFCYYNFHISKSPEFSLKKKEILFIIRNVTFVPFWSQISQMSEFNAKVSDSVKKAVGLLVYWVCHLNYKCV